MVHLPTAYDVFPGFFERVIFAFQLFYSVFKRLIGKVVIIELKNDLELKGTLHSVDQVGCHFLGWCRTT